MSSSSSITFSPLFPKRTMGQPFCFCKVEATLKFSNTTRNPGRPFLGCPNYNSKGLPYCKFFKWVDRNEENELQLRKKTNELERKEKELEMKDKELEKRLEYVEKREAELGKKSDEIEKRELLLANINEEVRKKELALVLREAKMSRSRTLLRVYWALAFVVACYRLASK